MLTSPARLARNTDEKGHKLKCAPYSAPQIDENSNQKRILKEETKANDNPKKRGLGSVDLAGHFVMLNKTYASLRSFMDRKVQGVIVEYESAFHHVLCPSFSAPKSYALSCQGHKNNHKPATL